MKYEMKIGNMIVPSTMKLQTFLPTLSLHHANIFVKLLFLSKKFTVYGPKYESSPRV